MDKILKDLNKEQYEAVTTTKGPLLIIAGAGSGKTRALTHRVGYLIKQGVPPVNILALTFTNRAAEEMRERVIKLLNQGSKKSFVQPLPFMGTFHALGAKILRKEIGLLKRSNNFIIYDEKDRRAMLKEIMALRKIDSDKFKPGGILATISAQKNELVSAEEYKEQAQEFYEKIVADVWGDYKKMMIEANAVDFDDLLQLPVNLFNGFKGVLEKYQRSYHYILVDEYQDTNHAQYVFLRQLAGKRKNICVVGDDWQSIYMFRGADFRNILNFEKDYPETKVVLLEENYRSTQNILDAAQAIIEKNELRTKKRLWTKKDRGEKVKIVRTENEREEATFLINEIEKTLENSPKYSLNDIAVLYRTNAQSRVIEEALIEVGLPYKIIGSVKFYERKEIKDIIAYLRIIINKDDIVSLKRIVNTPPRGIGKVNLERMIKGSHNEKTNKFLGLIKDLRADITKTTLSNLIKKIIKKTKYENYINDGTPSGNERWENVKEFMGVAKKFDELTGDEATQKFLEEIALLTPADDIDTKTNMVNLMTLHSVKGLEFPIVFIVGCEEGLLPHGKSIYDLRELEEERRLCYVGITRAKERAYLVFTRKREMFGSIQVNLPSRFLSEIPADLIDFEEYENTIKL